MTNEQFSVPRTLVYPPRNEDAEGARAIDARIWIRIVEEKKVLFSFDLNSQRMQRPQFRHADGSASAGNGAPGNGKLVDAETKAKNSSPSLWFRLKQSELVAVLMYMACSSTMLVVNKLAIALFPAPNLLLVVQVSLWPSLRALTRCHGAGPEESCCSAAARMILLAELLRTAPNTQHKQS